MLKQFLGVLGVILPVSGVMAETAVERGAYLVEGPAACGNCHTAPMPGAPAYGGAAIPEHGFVAQAPNITPAGRIANWSDAELGRAIREGIRPDGSVIGPPMPIGLYRGIGDSDLAAIVAYVRTLAPVETPFVATEYPFDLPPAYGPPIDSVADRVPGVSVEYGAYLAGPVAHCIECHSLKDGRPDIAGNLGGGGHAWEGPWGRAVAANLTSHADGLANYSDAEIKAMIAQGVKPDGTPMKPPMGYPFYARMSEADLDAIVMYLRTLPPLPDAQ
ncbi:MULTISPECIES: c-type cytochrome [unclassified Meridianimarinicoccus]|uniref:c-type cytochrome n=1 Tax=unclassified Meridianimarinicoccus TaxID=2923344 RepID=UPI00186730F2|nr:c-type cytochrome [Fluviibacterium sp. MJW13]